MRRILLSLFFACSFLIAFSQVKTVSEDAAKSAIEKLFKEKIHFNRLYEYDRGIHAEVIEHLTIYNVEVAKKFDEHAVTPIYTFQKETLEYLNKQYPGLVFVTIEKSEKGMFVEVMSANRKIAFDLDPQGKIVSEKELTAEKKE